MELSVRLLGLSYRIVCRDPSQPSASSIRGSSSLAREADEAAAGVGGTGRVLAVTSGFMVPPLGLMHCDILQVFTRGQRGEEGARMRGGMLGLGLLVGAATFAFGTANGCRKAEILAINDDPTQHNRLVAYYQRFGFQPVHVVRGGLADLPHMVVWGGAGTRMDANMVSMLRRWTPAVRRSSAAAGPAAGGGSTGAEQGGAAAGAAGTAAAGQEG